MQKAAILGLSLSEETITELALYNIAVAHQGADIVIELAKRPAEAKHGGDWEWWLVRGDRGLGFRVQAKRLFSDGLYRSLTVSGAKAYQQLDKLVSSSSSDGVEPLYCFFNCPHPRASFHKKNACSHSYNAPSFWGCSLAFPDQVKNVHSNDVSKLQPIMHPWHLLVCETKNNDLLRAGTKFIRERGGRDRSPGDLPSWVRRLIELGSVRRTVDASLYLDYAFWTEMGEIPDDLSGVIVVRDLRG